MYTVECPYCEYENEIDCIESDSGDEQCSNCEKEFEVIVENNPELIGTEIIEKTCDKCNKNVRTFNERGKCFPYPKNENYKVLCGYCYAEEHFNDRKEDSDE